MAKKQKKEGQSNGEAHEQFHNFNVAEQVREAITTKKDLKDFLTLIVEKLEDESCPLIYAMGALNYVLSLSNIYEIMSDDSRELAKQVWQRLHRAGLHATKPGLIFTEQESEAP